MPQITVSPEHQIVLPKEILREVSLNPGQVVQIVARNGFITLIPDRPLSSLRGYLKGMETGGLREKRERV